MIISKAINLQDNAYNCIECIDRGYYKERNCSGDLNNLKENIIDDSVRFTIKDNVINFCPKLLLQNDDVYYLLNAFAYFDSGIGINNCFYDGEITWVAEAMIGMKNIKLKYENEVINNG